MREGKLSNQVLDKYIIDKIVSRRKDVVVGPGVGRDSSIIDYQDYMCVVSTDPITASGNNQGFLGVHISCNDIAASGGEPVGIMLTILAPPDSELSDIVKVVEDAERACDELGIDILGGHTEVTDSVRRMVLSVTALGKLSRDKIAGGIVSKGMDVVMTKSAGLEGAAILAGDYADELSDTLTADELMKARGFMELVSVAKEGVTASNMGALYMHDATEGGIIGALWELSEAADCGIEIYYEKIIVEAETIKICTRFSINPLKLISSGCMVIIIPDGRELIDKLEDMGVSACIIGKTNDDGAKLLINNGKPLDIEPPEADELYNIKI